LIVLGNHGTTIEKKTRAETIKWNTWISSRHPYEYARTDGSAWVTGT
jgi:hypothetical protein